MGARGNSGVILSQILRGLGGDAQGARRRARARRWPRRSQAAAAAAYEAVLKPIEGTILTVVREAPTAPRRPPSGGSLADVAAGGARRPADGARRTPDCCRC